VRQPFRILSIDGGGIRGIIPAMVLAEIERRTGERVCELFDFFAGTSTGGILVLGLTKPKPDDPTCPQYAAEDMVGLYETHGPRIFSRSALHRILALGNLLDNKYPSGPVESVLEEFFGDVKISQAVKDVLITSYEIQMRRAFFFKSFNAKKNPDDDFLMRDAARATSAAPTYFEPDAIDKTESQKEKDRDKQLADFFALIDGGTYANNPAMCAVAEAVSARKYDRSLDDIFMLSLGTGEQKHPLDYSRVKGWGVVGWAVPLLNIVFHGVSDTVNYQTSLLLNIEGERPRHHRLQIELKRDEHPRSIQELDNTSPVNIERLKGLAEELIKNKSSEIDEICRVLAPKKRRAAAPGKTRSAPGKTRAAPLTKTRAAPRARAGAKRKTVAK
jgi:predicted acylesterase/phospholipase RssA